MNELETWFLLQSEVEVVVSTFRVLVDEVRRNIPDVLLATMSILFTNYKQLKANSVKASTSSPAMPSTSASSAVSGDGGMERHLSRLREQAKAVITFAGMIPYRMPGMISNYSDILLEAWQ